MKKYYLLHKPFGMLSQFTREGGHPSLADVDFEFESDVYSVGRLDTDSEGLLLLTNDKRLNSELLSPENGHPRTYHAQVEGAPELTDVRKLQNPMKLKIKGKEFTTRPCRVSIIEPRPDYVDRLPPVRVRKSIPDTWISITLTEGKNRQVRRMTAGTGFPTLRLIREAIGPFKLKGLKAGEVREISEEEVGKLI
ncbi:MAG TPA: pseudouridine synthase [Flavobacteriales bacterium]|nr:pseudouridine synthase [Flavobacteriales bacterium]HHZ96613.1 pseudouridine synthase [Flavobacteriales bacterium]HIN41340.1 pseudouridine synthase [Flavobacteriales bacterium]